MSIGDRLWHENRSRLFWLILALLGSISPDRGRAESCFVASEQSGIAFPAEKIAGDWSCRLQFVIDHHISASTVGPLKTAMAESLYLYLLDRPPVAAALINRLDLADYKSEERGPGRWWGSDGEGTEGMVQLVYQDRTTRVYYLEGRHHSRLLPNVSGKAVIFLRMRPVMDERRFDAMESTMVAYTMLDNRVLSGFVSLLRPLVDATVMRKLSKGVAMVNRLGVEIRQRPDRVLFEATDPPSLPEQDVAFLTQALSRRHISSPTPNSPRPAP
jgi:hypothetical protein